MKSDDQIRKDVEAELAWEPTLDAAQIGVAVQDGVVTLSGHVNSYFKKLRAEQAAGSVKGVHGVAVDLEVRLGTESLRNDTEIARAAVSALQWSSSVPDGQIKVSVDDGWVSLDGEVEWQYQKQAATDAVKSLTGVRGVHNRIRLAAPVEALAVHEDIRKALERNADLEAARITVETSGSKVTLSGKVRSWNERRTVERAAWASPGVTVVEDNLRISADLDN